MDEFETSFKDEALDDLNDEGGNQTAASKKLKGAVLDELNEKEKAQQKYIRLNEVWEVVSAFHEVLS